MPSGSGGGGGGFSRARAAAVFLSVAATMNAGGQVLYDSVDFDTDGFWSAAGHDFIVPAGMAGAYLCSHALSVNDNAALTVVQNFLGFAPEPNLSSPVANVTSRVAGNTWSIGLTALGQFAVGDAITARVGWVGPASIVVNTSSTFSIVYLGPLT